MSALDQALARLQAHDGVEHLLLLGRDGLLIRHLGVGSAADAETVAAMVPGLVSAGAQLGRAAGQGDLATAVLEFAGGVAIVVALSRDLLIALTLRPGIGFAPLLREVRGERDRLASLL